MAQYIGIIGQVYRQSLETHFNCSQPSSSVRTTDEPKKAGNLLRSPAFKYNLKNRKCFSLSCPFTRHGV